MIMQVFFLRLRALHRVRIIAASANETMISLSALLAALALFSLADFIFPMSFRIRRFILIAFGLYFLTKLFSGIRKILKKAYAKTCDAAGAGVLKAFELARNKENLTALGISGELIDEEIKGASEIIKMVSPFSLVSFNLKAGFITLLGAAVLFFNGVSAGRVIIPRREDIGRFLTVEMKKFAVKGESWEAHISARSSVWPRAMLSFPSSSWVERKLTGADGRFAFRIEKCFEPFKIRFRWKNLYSAVYDIKLYERPRVLERKIRIKYPSYLNLKDEESSFGGFAAFPGTLASACIKSSHKLESAHIIAVFEGKKKIIPMSVSLAEAEGQFTASGAGSWRVELLSREGIASSGTVVWTVEDAEDAPPQAYILSPGEDIVINESFSGIDLEWLGEDDFGIKEVFFCYSKNGAPLKKIKIFEGYSKTCRGRWNWKLSDVMVPDDVTEYWVLALDAALKQGESRRFTLTLKDFLATHKKNMKEEERIKEDVFGIYQKQAELNIARNQITDTEIIRLQREIENKLLSLADAAGNMARRAEKDPLYSSYYSSEYRGLQKALDEQAAASSRAQGELESGSKQGAFRTQDEIEASLEKLASFSEELFKRSSMDNLGGIGRESAEIADKLDNFLSSSPDAEKLGELMELTDRIEKLVRELAETIKNMPQTLPEEFVNSDSVKSMDFNATQSSLSALKDALSSGDISSAVKRAKELLENLSRLRKSFEQASENVSPMSIPMDKKDTRLEEIIKDEENIISSTEKFLFRSEEKIKALNARKAQKLRELASGIKNSSELMRNDSKKLFGSDAPRLSQGLYRLNRNVSDFAERFLDKGFDFESLLGEASRELETMTAMELSSSTLKKLRETSSDIADFFDIYRDTSVPPLRPEDIKYAMDISSFQLSVSRKTSELEKKIYEYSRQSAQFPPNIARNIKAARREMTGAARAMAEAHAGDSFVFQEKALYYLKKAQKGMDAFEFIPQSSSGGPPMPSFFPSSGNSPGTGKSSQGMGFQKADFPIPSSPRPGYDGASEIINDAMRGERPPKYKDMLKEYYDQLLK
ncbi:DUF4175 family protein [bacterium]|nr:DUF4175 family protein [bacterium]